MAKPQRIYVIIDKYQPARWLVRAINPHVALRRVVTGRYVSRVASQEELVRLTSQGVEVLQGGGKVAEPEEDLFDEPADIDALP